MGSFVFKWEHPAEEVYVTGTFDDWTKSVKLEKIDQVFQKDVQLRDASKKIYYKFVVDGNWITNQSAPQEADEGNNVNNVLTPENIRKPSGTTTKPDHARDETLAVPAIMSSSVGPNATTVGLASDVPPVENDRKDETTSDMPGRFPETPAAEADKTVSINPLPATAGAVNPISVAPGQPLPAMTTTGDGIHEHVKLDKDSYDKADTLPGLDDLSSFSPFPADPAPESGGGPAGLDGGLATMSTVSPDATTAQLAGKVPLESKLAAHDNNTESAKETGGGSSATATATAAVTAAYTSAMAAGSAVAERMGPYVDQAAANLPDSVKQALPASMQSALPISTQSALAVEAKEEKIETVSPEVPAEVRESIAESGRAPEAAANTEAVEAKKEMETELLQEIKPAGEESKTAEKKKVAVESEEPKKSAFESEEPVKSAFESEQPKKSVFGSEEPKSDAVHTSTSDAFSTAALSTAAPPTATLPTAFPDAAPITADAPVDNAIAAPVTVKKAEEPAVKLAAPAAHVETPAKPLAPAVDPLPKPAASTNGATNNNSASDGDLGAAASPLTDTAHSDKAKTEESGNGSGSLKKKNRLSVMFGKIKQKFSPHKSASATGSNATTPTE